jgi:hypothetical protein
MKHIEVHVIEREDDVASALSSGLLMVGDLDGASCSDCSERVAYVDGAFIAFAVVLDEMDEPWFLCEECVAPVVEPSITSNQTSFEDLFIADEEFDDFDLEDDI